MLDHGIPDWGSSTCITTGFTAVGFGVVDWIHLSQKRSFCEHVYDPSVCILREGEFVDLRNGC